MQPYSPDRPLPEYHLEDNAAYPDIGLISEPIPEPTPKEQKEDLLSQAKGLKEQVKELNSLAKELTDKAKAITE